MKAIFVCFDTLNRRLLPPYGCDWVHAPNFSRLAERAVTFDNAYVGSMPCMPARRELHTGRYNFLHRSWGPLEPFDESMPELLTQHGVYTHLVSDHPHYWEDGGATYHTRYRTWEIVRGQEGDPWKGQVANPEMPESPRNMRGELWRQDWVNRHYLQREEDMPQAQVFSRALEFLRTNQSQDNWFLQIETFDPHEPFYTQQHYKALYPHHYSGPHFDWPDYAPVTQSAEEVEHIRYEYAALVSMCDHYLGQVLNAMDELAFWGDTLLIVGTDHGFLLGEHDWWAKSVQPWYSELAHIPLFIWDPRDGTSGARRDSLVQWIDFAPTLLEFFQIPIPESMQGMPLRERVALDTPARPAGLFGIFGGHVNVTDGRYVYMRAPIRPDNMPLFEYTLMPTHMRSRFAVSELQEISLSETFSFTQGVRPLKIPGRSYTSAYTFGTMLFDLATDPTQEHPIINDEVELRMIGLLVEWMHWNDAPREQFERLGLPAEGKATYEYLLCARHYELVQQALCKQRATAAYTGPGAIYLTLPFREIMALPTGEAVLRQHFSELIEHPDFKKIMQSVSPQQAAGFVPGIFSPERLAAFAADLAARTNASAKPFSESETREEEPGKA
ncbi:sulfatase [Reticulibacter mediterranei]|uniref:Sulfatase n=1 Tax=Reticulibacter mediterranei TaxID=2778369 RepID=A0A8J3MZC1_9CHLR|nr:sulfatase [Reticulibacter mediterranei]GHO90293.1 sulfatase [Reticulibacter mediterranei]